MGILNKFFIILVLIGMSFIPLIDLFHPGLPITHDGQDHVARIANFYQNLSEGNIIPRWAGNLNWGYGHPILEFLYPLPSYLVSLFYFLGFTLVDAIKIVFGMSFILSGITMYIFVKELLRDENAAFFASTLYIIAPYRFVDLYVRGAIGEHVAFIFPPLILYFILKLNKRPTLIHIIGGAFSLTGLILSHNAITLMFLPIILLYAIYLVWSSKKVFTIYYLLFTILLGFGLSAFFWIPAFLEGKYTLRDIVTGGGEYVRSFSRWKEFFYLSWSYGGTMTLSKQIGIVHWIGVFGSVIATYFLFRNKNKLWIISLGTFVILQITLFLMTDASNPIWRSIGILQKFQFPWRFLSVAVFLSSLLGAFMLQVFKGKYKIGFLLVLTVSLLVVNKDYWRANGFLQKEESFYKGIYNGTTDTGESAPIWSVRFMEKRPISKVEIIQGKGEIREIKRNFTKREYKVKATDKIRILENTLYFPGWTVLVDGRKENIEFQDQNYRGLITFYVDKGEHFINIIYKETKTRRLADTISLASLLTLILFSIFKSVEVKKAYNKKAKNL